MIIAAPISLTAYIFSQPSGLGTQSGPITEVAQRESEIPVVYGALS